MKHMIHVQLFDRELGLSEGLFNQVDLVPWCATPLGRYRLKYAQESEDV